MIKFRRQHPLFRQSNWLEKGHFCGFNADGSEITQEEGENLASNFIVFLNGAKIEDDDFLLCFNAQEETVEFILPDELQSRDWQVIIDTNEVGFVKENRIYQEDQEMEVKGRSLVVLKSI